MLTEIKSAADSGSAVNASPAPKKASIATKRKRTIKKNRVAIVHNKKGMNENRDYSKYVFNNKRLGKGKLVLALIQQYVKDHPNTTPDAIKKKFPGVANYDIIVDASKARKLSNNKKRYFVGSDQVITINKRTFAVTNQITSSNIVPILKVARTVGYNVRHATK